MPDWLSEYQAEQWAEDLGDVLAVNYGRIRWAAARRAWAEGRDPRPYFGPPIWETEIVSPRPVPGGSANTFPVAPGEGEGNGPTINRASVPRIKLH